jgi:hypothetical protein
MRDANEYASNVENTRDEHDVKAVFCLKSHSRNTIVGLPLMGLSLIFEGQHCSKRDDKGDLQR